MDITGRKDNFNAWNFRLRNFLLGIILFVFGVLLLMSRAGVVQLDFTRIIAFLLLMVGGFESIRTFASSSRESQPGNRRRLFWASAIFLTGMLIGLVSYELVPGSWDQIWPVALLIPGLAFLMLYFSNPKEYSLLIVVTLFIATGVAGLLFVNHNLNFGENFFEMFRFLVPAAIILTGFYVIWKNFFKIK